VAPVDRERVEHVPEHAGVGEHQHPAAAQVDPAAREVAVEVAADRAVRIAEVVGRPEPGERTQPEREPGQRVEVDQPQ
jgi:hypothetical protein